MRALILLVAVALLALGVRALRLRLALKRVPVRIHVGGTRGKSSVCRLIANALNEAGVRTLGKTTGTDPLLILPDSSVHPWDRFGPASIAEQRRFAILAGRSDVGATVLECMAIRPDLVAASERDLVRATIAVITNLRPDHLEEMPSMDAIAEGAMGIVPRNGVLVADEAVLSERLRAHAAARGTRVVAVGLSGLGPDEANRALASAVCELVGAGKILRSDPALAGDPGRLAIYRFGPPGRQLRFANAFACNDVVSFEMLRQEHPCPTGSLQVVLNHRNDRPLRSIQFLDHFASLPQRPSILLLRGTFWLRRAARRRGLEVRTIAATPCRSARDVLSRIAAELPTGALVWGVGNYHGPGAAIVRLLEAEAACSR